MEENKIIVNSVGTKPLKGETTFYVHHDDSESGYIYAPPMSNKTLLPSIVFSNTKGQ
jgi:hypothetical protein